MKTILIIGLGRFGRHCARKLNEMGHQVMAVDVREDRVDTVLPYVTDGLIGNSTRADFMKTLGVRNYDVCIVAIGDDFQSSLETTALLKDLGAQYVVARAARDVHARFLARNGASKDEIRSHVENEYGYDLNRTVDEIRPDYTFDVSCAGSVPESIICFLDADDFEDTIRNAVSLGGDADTQAAISGSIAGAYWEVPEYISDEAIGYLDDMLLDVLNEFCDVYG